MHNCQRKDFEQWHILIIVLFQPHPPPTTTTTLPSLKEMELCAQSVITVWASRFGSGYLIWLLVCLGTFMRQQGSGPLALPSSHFNKSATNTWPVDGRWGALLETAVLTDGDRDEWQWQGRLQCHLTDQTVWRPGPLKCDAESTWRGPSDIKRKKKKKKGDGEPRWSSSSSYHIV